MSRSIPEIEAELEYLDNEISDIKYERGQLYARLIDLEAKHSRLTAELHQVSEEINNDVV
jgi:chromosome segregation ATPase